MKVDKKAITRIVVGIAGLLKIFGFDIPEEMIDQAVNGLSSLAILWAMWKDNDLKPSTVKWKERFRNFIYNVDEK